MRIGINRPQLSLLLGLKMMLLLFIVTLFAGSLAAPSEWESGDWSGSGSGWWSGSGSGWWSGSGSGDACEEEIQERLAKYKEENGIDSDQAEIDGDLAIPKILIDGEDENGNRNMITWDQFLIISSENI